jgi:hypothetical protein
LIEFADFDVKLQKKPTKWDTANGIMQTDGSVIIEKFSLPHFSRKRFITTSFHMYQKTAKDKYDFIIGRDLLTDLGLDIHYSASQFVWDHVIVDMVPSGYWTKEKISNLATIWNSKRKPTLGNENKVESAKEEITMEISAQTVESKAKYDTNLDQIITNLPPARTSKLVLTFQEENVADATDNRLLSTIAMEHHPNYEKQTAAEKTPASQKAKPDGSETAAAMEALALPVQPCKKEQQNTLITDANGRRSHSQTETPTTITKDPFTITQVFDNGTVSINYGRVMETINIRRIEPYHH